MPLPLALLGRLEEAEAVGLSACELIRKIHAWGDPAFASAALAYVAVARVTLRRNDEPMKRCG